jgi:hypothetical protein
MADDLADVLERPIPLTEMIRSLKDELRLATNELAGLEPRLTVERAEIKLTLVVERSRVKGGGLDLRVVSFGSKWSNSSTDTHTFTLVLVPERSLKVSGKRRPPAGAQHEDS